MMSSCAQVKFLERLAGAQRGSEGVLIPIVPKVVEPEVCSTASIIGS